MVKRSCQYSQIGKGRRLKSFYVAIPTGIICNGALPERSMGPVLKTVLD
jgi:hypothetical protein